MAAALRGRPALPAAPGARTALPPPSAPLLWEPRGAAAGPGSRGRGCCRRRQGGPAPGVPARRPRLGEAVSVGCGGRGGAGGGSGALLTLRARLGREGPALPQTAARRRIPLRRLWSPQGQRAPLFALVNPCPRPWCPAVKLPALCPRPYPPEQGQRDLACLLAL